MLRVVLTRRSALAVVLATVAGFVDAVGFIVLHGLFTAHMSGNAAQVGVHLGQGGVQAAVPLLVAIALFVLGCGLGATLDELVRRAGVPSRDAPLLGLQALLVAAFMVYGNAEVGAGRAPDHELASFYVLAALAIVSIGVQAATLTQVGGETIRTAYISGVLTNLGQALALHLVPAGRGFRRPPAWRTALLAAIALVYLAGATAGSLLHAHIGIWAMAAPLALLVLAAAADLVRPLDSPSAVRTTSAR